MLDSEISGAIAEALLVCKRFADRERERFQVVIPIIKGIDPADERYVLGIVLEPETIDAQGDIVSKEEIRKAAHLWMERYRVRGLQHKRDISDRVSTVESYLAPCELAISGVTVKEGSWLMGWRINDDDLWSGIKTGVWNGFSMGGTAGRVAENVD